MGNHLLFYDDILNKIENKSLLYKIPMLIRVDGLKETLRYLYEKDKEIYQLIKDYIHKYFNGFNIDNYVNKKETIDVIQEIRIFHFVYEIMKKMILVNEHLENKKIIIDAHLIENKNNNQRKNSRNTKAECKYLKNKSLKIYKELYEKVATIDVKTVKNMVVGLGEASVKEVSMKKHHLFDVPYIPASSMKGIFRHFCEEDANVDKNKVEKWFGTEEQEGQLVFVDLYPTNIDKYKIEEDVMTPHYSSYYTDDSNKKLPVDSDKTIPIKFTVLSNTSFAFRFYSKINLESSEKQELNGLFMKCIHERLFGAKTSVGYGQVVLDTPKEQVGVSGQITEILQENKNRKNINIKFDTQLLSHGANKKKVEFRITELKSAMRYWWRACNTFNSVEKMKEEEGEIFGNQKQISPLLLRDIKNEKFGEMWEGKKELIETNIIVEVRDNHRNTSQIESENGVDNTSENKTTKCTSTMDNGSNKRNTDSTENNKKKDLDFYDNILYLTSFLGGVGQKSRKGKGVFSIDGKPIIETEEELGKEIKRVLELVSNTEWGEIEIKKNYCKIERKYQGVKRECELGENTKLEGIKKEDNSDKINKKDKALLLNYPYIEEIYIGKPITKKEFEDRVENTIEKRTEGNSEYNFTNRRFASPVYITCYRAKEDYVFPIVTILHNTTLKNIESSEKKNNTMKKSYKEKYRKNWNKNKGNSSKENEEVYYENYKAVCIETMFDSNDH